MRCLYCGNELPVFRKLTGGGEFCSEAHRQKYQEEYNRLALSRLMQAQAPEERPKPLQKETVEVVAAGRAEAVLVEAALAPANGAAHIHNEATSNGKASASASASGIATEPEDESGDPPADPADFLWEVPDAIWWESAELRPSEAALISSTAVSQTPAGVGLLQVDLPEAEEFDLAMGSPVPLSGISQSTNPRDFKTRTRESRLELREIGRAEPKLTIQLGNSNINGLQTTSTALNFEMLPKVPPPIVATTPWSLPDRPFPENSVQLEFAEWLQLDFSTSGIEVPSEDGGEPQIVQVAAPQILSRLADAGRRNAPQVTPDLHDFLKTGEPVGPIATELAPVESAAVELEESTPSGPVIPETVVQKPELEALWPEITKIWPDVDSRPDVHPPADAVTAVESEAPVSEPIAAEPEPATHEPEALTFEPETVDLEPVAIVPETVALGLEPPFVPGAVQQHSSAIAESEQPSPDVPRVVAQFVEPAPPADPKRVDTALPIHPRALAPQQAKTQPAFSWVSVTSFRMHLPRVTSLPMRPAMVFG
ncbi:MAG: hypothetical protein ABI823_09375, partial [Bryobacteraceae bacterium]